MNYIFQTVWIQVRLLRSSLISGHSDCLHDISLAENQNDLELDFKVFFFVDSCCAGTVLDEST